MSEYVLLIGSVTLQGRPKGLVLNHELMLLIGGSQIRNVVIGMVDRITVVQEIVICGTINVLELNKEQIPGKNRIFSSF